MGCRVDHRQEKRDDATMATRELKAKYDKSNQRDAINAAIRAELPGGSALLDVLEIAHLAVGRRDLPAEAQQAIGRILNGLLAAKAALEAEIRRRWPGAVFCPIWSHCQNGNYRFAPPRPAKIPQNDTFHCYYLQSLA
jgi:hypothetical protein